MFKRKKQESSHVQYVLRTGWNWNISYTAGCIATSLVNRPRGTVDIEEKIVLERILNRIDSEYSSVAQDGVSHSFKAITD
jgi:hypothetical protein